RLRPAAADPDGAPDRPVRRRGPRQGKALAMKAPARAPPRRRDKERSALRASPPPVAADPAPISPLKGKVETLAPSHGSPRPVRGRVGWGVIARRDMSLSASPRLCGEIFRAAT